MTESEYINATNLAKVRAMIPILRTVYVDGEIIKTVLVAYRQMMAWEKRLEKAVVVTNDAEGAATPEGRK